jgi:O-antigen ligase
MRMKKKSAGIAVLILFSLVFAWQAGDLMMSRAGGITDTEDTSSSGRIDAWKASIGMMAAHPLTGVGFAAFGQAFPDFSNATPRIAHNTFFQIGGEWGVLAAITYLVLIFSTLNRLRKNGNALRELTTHDAKLCYCINESCLLGLTGFFICSMFLSLEKYEFLYYLLFMSNGTLLVSRRVLTASETSAVPAPPEHGPRWRRTSRPPAAVNRAR